MGDLQTLTNSSAGCYRACPRRYYWRHEMRLRSSAPKAEALHLGTLVHQGLETILSRQQVLPLPEGDPADPTVMLAGAMLRGYQRRWPELPAVLAVEQQFWLPLRAPGEKRAEYGWRWGGKIDAVDEGPRGPRIIEHKTAASTEGDYLDKLWSDSQITSYCAAASILYGRPVREVLYDVLVKPGFRRGESESDALWASRLEAAYVHGRIAGTGVKRRGSESDEEFVARIVAEGTPWNGYHREELVLSDEQIGQWYADTVTLIEMLRWSRRTGSWPHHTRSCYEWQRPCEYLPICRAGDRVEASGALYQESDSAHEELSL